MHLKRRLNYTGRKRINKSSVDISVFHEDEGPATFTAVIDFSKMGLPEDAPVIVEARQKDMLQRFICGTVGGFALPDQAALTEVDADSPLSFWVRVLDPARGDGRLLAVGRSIQPKGDGPEDQGRDTLLALKSKDLGQVSWTIEFPSSEEGIPWLVINSRIPAAMEMLETNPLYQGLIFPAAVREILAHIRLEGGNPEEGTWQHKWLAHGAKLADEPCPDEADGSVDDWIDAAARGFCEHFRITERTLQHLKEASL